MKQIILILFLSSCSLVPHSETTDKSISSKEAPAFLKTSVPKDAREIEYFKKLHKDTITYELKYEVSEQGISLTYSEDGQFLEREEDIKFSTLAPEIQTKIKKHLAARYKKFKIHETELRTDKEKNDFIDVEIIHHQRPTGHSELSFTKNGEFVSEEVENFSEIETMF